MLLMKKLQGKRSDKTNGLHRGVGISSLPFSIAFDNLITSAPTFMNWRPFPLSNISTMSESFSKFFASKVTVAWPPSS